MILPKQNIFLGQNKIFFLVDVKVKTRNNRIEMALDHRIHKKCIPTKCILHSNDVFHVLFIGGGGGGGGRLYGNIARKALQGHSTAGIIELSRHVEIVCVTRKKITDSLLYAICDWTNTAVKRNAHVRDLRKAQEK